MCCWVLPPTWAWHVCPNGDRGVRTGIFTPWWLFGDIIEQAQGAAALGLFFITCFVWNSLCHKQNKPPREETPLKILSSPTCRFCSVLIWFGFFCLVCWFVFCLVFVFFPSFVFSGVWSCKNHQGKAYTATWSGCISVKLTSHQACSSDGRFWGLCCCVFLCLAPRMWSLVVWQCSGNNEVFSVSGFRMTRSITWHPQGDSKGKAKSWASLNSSPPLSGHAFPGPLQAPGCAEHPLETPSGSFHQPGNRQGNRSRADSHGQLNPGQTKRFPPMWSPFLFVYFFSRPVSPP